MQPFKQNSEVPVDKSGSNASSALDHPFVVSRSVPILHRDYLRNAEWTLIENARYLAFIELNSKKMEGRPHAKLWPLYQEMGKFIRSRNFRQCKSYHQKMVDAHSTIPDIVGYLVGSCPELEPLVGKQKESLGKIQMQSGLRIPQDGSKTELKTAVEVISQKQVPLSQQVIRNQQDEWKECHQLFVEWTNRLRNLMWEPTTAFV